MLRQERYGSLSPRSPDLLNIAGTKLGHWFGSKPGLSVPYVDSRTESQSLGADGLSGARKKRRTFRIIGGLGPETAKAFMLVIFLIS